jgi:hypothetical protein
MSQLDNKRLRHKHKWTIYIYGKIFVIVQRYIFTRKMHSHGKEGNFFIPIMYVVFNKHNSKTKSALPMLLHQPAQILDVYASCPGYGGQARLYRQTFTLR